MLCQQCGKDLGTNAVCPDCSGRAKQARETGGIDYSGILEAVKRGDYPAHIAGLDVSEKLKRAFTTFEAFNATQPLGLFAGFPKEALAHFKKLPFKERYAITKSLQTQIWWAFFFGGFYYLFAGMWRKGVVVLAGTIAIALTILIVWEDMLNLPEMPRWADMGISVGIAYATSMMATYDLYRSKVKKEVAFWW